MSERLERLQRSLELALNQEWPQLSATQMRLAKLRPKLILIRPDTGKRMAVVATVATDGGGLEVEMLESLLMQTTICQKTLYGQQ